MNKLNIRNPPKTENFSELFHYIWNHGVGNQLNNTGDPIAWTAEDMEFAFDSFGKSISLRTIQHWKSGRYLPSRKNMHILARIVSGGNDGLKQEWADALIYSLNKDKVEKKIAPSKPTEDPVGIKPKPNRLRMFATVTTSLFLLSVITVTVKKQLQPDANFIAVASFRNLTSDSDIDYLTNGLTEDIYSSLVKVPRLKTLSRRSVRAIESDEEFIKKLRHNHYVKFLVDGNLRQEGSFQKISLSLIDVHTGQVIWENTFNTQQENLFDIHQTVMTEITDILGAELPIEFSQPVLTYGTADVEAYSYYLRARHLVKYWHEKRTGPSIWEANEAFDRALKLDPRMGKAAFHKADAYYHYAAGDEIQPNADVNTKIPTTSLEASEFILDMMSQATRNSHSPTELSQAHLNSIYFSDDWSKLREIALEYSDLVVKERGELEWFFGPVTLLFLNEEEALQNLIKDRVLRYDPLNGTGHAYAVRQYLVSNQPEKAWARLNRAEVATFSSRIDEVKGYLLIANLNGEGLKEHVRSAPDLSPLYQDYFLALSQYLMGDTQSAKAVLLSSELLKKEKLHLAFGLNHIGETSAAEELLNSIANEPMGTVLLSVAMSYGAACGPISLPPIPALDAKMKRAGISKLPCIGAAPKN